MNAVLKLDKTRIRRSFAAASGTYDSVAQLQRNVGKELLRLVGVESLTGTLLDLGCGTGFLTSEMLRLKPNHADSVCIGTAEHRVSFVSPSPQPSRQPLLRCSNYLHPCRHPAGEGAECRFINSEVYIIALDIAWSMLQTTRRKLSDHEGVVYLCADAEYLPLADQSVDSVMSNLALQWCVNLTAVFADIKRVLKADGRLFFSTFGPETLKELKAAWSGVDDYHHVNEFYGEEQIRTFLLQAGFSDIRMQRITYLSRYDSVMALMVELKNIGAHNVTAGRNKNFTTKTRLQQMIAAYEKHRVDGQIPATFDVILVSASK